MPLKFNSMGQKFTKKWFMQDIQLRKPLCAAMILCSWFASVPASVMATDDIAVVQTVNQQITAKGTVVEPNGEPIIGASVKVEGSSTGTITDFDGNFSLAVPTNAKLIISYVGYQTQVFHVKSGAPIRIVLQEDSKVLDEVVVVGYGAVKRANLTGAVASVKMDELKDIPATNMTSLLMGTMPGVTVGESTGNPIADASIKIRTNGSWNAEDPLYVIDGFIRDAAAFNLLDASEIDNISVLKDASAAVYGVRGAGGVILVTTKRGSDGKTSINYSGSIGFSDGISMPDMMSAYQQATALNDMWREQVQHNGANPDSYRFFSEQELNDLQGVDYNWLDQAWQTALNTRHTLNVSGGSEKVRYFVGGSYTYADGNFADLNANRFNVRMGLDVKFTNDLKASFNMNYATKSIKMPLNNKDKEAQLMYGTFSDLTRMPRWIPAYIDGLPVGNGMTSSETHPLAIFDSGSSRKKRDDNTSISAKFDYNVRWVKGLSASVSMNYARTSANGRNIYRPYTVYTFENIAYDKGDGTTYQGRLVNNTITGTQQLTNGASYYDGADFGYSYQINPQLNYNRVIGKNNISAMYVFEVAESNSNALSITANDVVVDNVNSLQGFNNNGLTGGSSFQPLTRRLSHIARLNYSYADRYLFEGTLRYEGSTNFATKHRWGLFYSFSGSWRISEEVWFKENVRGVENLKLRASYGRIGNDKAVLGQWRQAYQFGTGNLFFGGDNGTLQTLLEPKLSGLVALNSSWEKTDSYNVGVDFMMQNGLSFEGDYFFKHTYDILDDAKSTFPQSAGVAGSTPRLNYGAQNAWGFEFAIGYRKQINSDWSVNAKGNFAFSRSKVLKKYQNPGIVGTWQDEEGRIRGGEVGYKVWKGKDGKGDGMARTWQDIEDYIDYLTSHTTSGNKSDIDVLGLKWDKLRPGMLMYQDFGTTVNNQTPDGIINQSGDNCIISKYDSAPYNYSLTLGFNWKNLSVSALLSGQFGHDVVFDKGFYTSASGGARTGDFLSEQSNLLSEWYGNYAIANEDGSLVNPDAIYPRLDSDSKRGERSDFWMRNGHSLRLRTLNVSYSLPRTVLAHSGIGSCRVFFTANNLWTILNPFPYKDAYVGYWSDYPQIRTFNFGINIGF